MASVCLDEGNISSYAAIMESFEMRNYQGSNFIRLFLPPFDAVWQSAKGLQTIENTYAQLL